MQNEPIFLNLDDILQIHQDTISTEGGSDGVRDIALIDSAVSAPKATFGGEYLHDNLAAMSAALMFALISNHGFVDGNKRVGALAALVFRDINDEDTFPPSEELEATALSVARGEMCRDELADWWRQWSSIGPLFRVGSEKSFKLDNNRGVRFEIEAELCELREEDDLKKITEEYLWGLFDKKTEEGTPPAAIAISLYWLKRPAVRCELSPSGGGLPTADCSMPRREFVATFSGLDRYRRILSK